MRTDELITTIEELDQLAAKLCAIRWHRNLPDDTDLKSGLFGALNSLGAECGFLVQKLENERIAAEAQLKKHTACRPIPPAQK